MFSITLRMAIDLEHEEVQTPISYVLANSAMEQSNFVQAEGPFRQVLQGTLAVGTMQDTNAAVEISLKLSTSSRRRQERGLQLLYRVNK